MIAAVAWRVASVVLGVALGWVLATGWPDGSACEQLARTSLVIHMGETVYQDGRLYVFGRVMPLTPGDEFSECVCERFLNEARR